MSAGIVFLYFSNDEGTNIKDKTLRIFELIKIFELAKTMPQLCFEIIFKKVSRWFSFGNWLHELSLFLKDVSNLIWFDLIDLFFFKIRRCSDYGRHAHNWNVREESRHAEPLQKGNETRDEPSFT